jgi:hypothetical protein
MTSVVGIPVSETMVILNHRQNQISPSLSAFATASTSPSSFLATLRTMVKEMKEALLDEESPSPSPSPSASQEVNRKKNDKLNLLAQKKKGFWEVASSTNELTNVNFDLENGELVDNSEIFEFVSLLKELMLMHGRFVVGVEESVL